MSILYIKLTLVKILPVAEEAKSVLWGTILNADAERESPFEVEHGGGVPLSKEKKQDWN